MDTSNPTLQPTPTLNCRYMKCVDKPQRRLISREQNSLKRRKFQKGDAHKGPVQTKDSIHHSIKRGKIVGKSNGQN